MRSQHPDGRTTPRTDRKSTRLNSSHRCISYAVFCLKKTPFAHATRFETVKDLLVLVGAFLSSSQAFAEFLGGKSTIVGSFLNNTAPPVIYALCLHVALPN